MKKSFLVVGGGQLLSALSQAFFVVLILRSASTGEFAKYTLAISAFYIATSLSSSAFQRAYFIEYESVVQPHGRLAFLLAQITVGLCVIVTLQVLFPLEADLGLLISIYVATGLFYESLRWELQREERFVPFTVTNIAQNLLNLALVGGGVLVSREISAQLLIFSQVLSRMFIIASMIICGSLRNSSWYLTSPHKPLFALIAKGYATLALFHVLDGLLSQAAILLLSRTGSLVEMASYGAALRLIGVTAVAVATARSVLLPILGKAKELSEAEGNRPTYLLISGMLTLVIITIAVAAPVWIPSIDGGRYPKTIVIFQILALGTALNLWSIFDATLLVRRRCHKRLCVYVLTALILNGATSAAFIPRYGATGAAVGTLVGLATFSALVMLRGRLLRSKPLPC